jgi:hypothetical protein
MPAEDKRAAAGLAGRLLIFGVRCLVSALVWGDLSPLSVMEDEASRDPMC